MSNFFEELKTRYLNRVAITYAVSGWLILQVANTIGNNLGWPNATAAVNTKY